MSDTKALPPGTFSWMELATEDPERAKVFYGEVLGWSFIQDDLPDGGFYIMAAAGEKGVSGMYSMPEEMAAAGIPPFWLCYVTVEDVALAAAKVTELGGQLVKPPFEVMDYGRMAVCADPTGAPFALWQAGSHAGADPGDGDLGTRCWNELVSSDVDKSSAFFTALFGWTASTMPMGGEQYTMFKQGEQMVAGLMSMDAQAGPMAGIAEGGEMPSTWVAYFIVSDCDAAVSQAEALGGKALFPAFDMPNVGRSTWLADPDGAIIGLLQPPTQST